MPRSLIFCIILIGLPSCSIGQEQFIQFLAPTLENESQCRWLESLLSEKPEIKSVRAESFSNNVLVFSEPGTIISEQQIEVWCQESGYNITCYRSGIKGVDRILRLDISDCDHPVESKDE